jgi:hypothetical protein
MLGLVDSDSAIDFSLTGLQEIRLKIKEKIARSKFDFILNFIVLD